MSINDIAINELLNEALIQEEQAEKLLLDKVAYRVLNDERFRRRLSNEPESAVREVFESLPTEQRKQAGNEEVVIKNTVEKAQALMSKVLPEIDKKRVEDLVFQTIEDMRRSFTLILKLSQILFFSGLGLIATTFIAALIVDTQHVIELILGWGTGIAAVFAALLINPIDKVQNAAGNLVQIEIAFLGYYKQISLLVPPSGATIQDVVQYVNEVGQAMRESISLSNSRSQNLV